MRGTLCLFHVGAESAEQPKTLTNRNDAFWSNILYFSKRIDYFALLFLVSLLSESNSVHPLKEVTQLDKSNIRAS